MMPETSQFDPIDFDACERFEQAWIGGAPSRIEQFLPDQSERRYVGTLVQLIKSELRHLWMRYREELRQPAPITVVYGPKLEAYLQRFPVLSSSPRHVAELAKEECRVRRRFGNPPQAGEYATRFPQLADQPDIVAQVSQEHAPRTANQPSIPRYQILGELGRGGMGVVYLAFDERLQRRIALKMILAPALSDPEYLSRFFREAAAVARLQHPNVVQVHDVGDHEGQHYLTLEYVAGGTLAEKLRRDPPHPKQAAAITAVLARAVQAAHEQGIIHRDLKPANVLLDEQNRYKISDFGLAKLPWGRPPPSGRGRGFHHGLRPGIAHPGKGIKGVHPAEARFAVENADMRSILGN